MAIQILLISTYYIQRNLIYFGAKWRFDVDIDESVDPFHWILKYKKGGGQDSSLEPNVQVVRVGEGWVNSEQVLLTNCSVAK